MRVILTFLISCYVLTAHAQDTWAGAVGEDFCMYGLDNINAAPIWPVAFFAQLSAFNQALAGKPVDIKNGGCHRHLAKHGSIVNNLGAACEISHTPQGESETLTLHLPADIHSLIKTSGTVKYILFDSANAPHIRFNQGANGLSGRITNLCAIKYPIPDSERILIEYVPDDGSSGRGWYELVKVP